MCICVILCIFGTMMEISINFWQCLVFFLVNQFLAIFLFFFWLNLFCSLDEFFLQSSEVQFSQLSQFFDMRIYTSECFAPGDYSVKPGQQARPFLYSGYRIQCAVQGPAPKLYFCRSKRKVTQKTWVKSWAKLYIVSQFCYIIDASYNAHS